MSIPIYASVNVHIQRQHEIEAGMNEQEGRRYMTLGAGGAFGVMLYINDKSKALEIANAIISAAEGWQEDQEKAL